MKEFHLVQLGLTLFISALVTAWGCENVSLVGRETLDSSYGGRREIDRRYGNDYGRDRFEDNWRRQQISGTVEAVDEQRREIRLRAQGDGLTLVRYDRHTRIFDGGRNLPVGSLRPGDQVSIQLDRSSSGEPYAYAIRVEDQRDSWRR